MDGASVLTKGVARNGFVSASAYKYYKVNGRTPSRQPLTLELTTSNGNADLYVANVATVDWDVRTSEHEHGERVGFRDDFEFHEWILLREQ